MLEPTGSLATALAQGRRLLAARPAQAEEQALEILKVISGQPQALLLLMQARRAQNNHKGARAALNDLRKTIGPDDSAGWRALGDQLTAQGDSEAADDAYARHIKASVNDPELFEAASALCDNRLAVAERLLRSFLKEHPTDVAAMRMLAETGSRVAAYDDAEKLLERALELAPGFTAARHNYAAVLHRQMKSEAALTQVDILLKEEPNNSGYLALRASVLARIGEHKDAIQSYETLLRRDPSQPKAWMSYGHTLKTVGRQDESIKAYRKSIALLPNLGESYWSLANLKTFRFTRDDAAAMRAQLERTDILEEDRFHLHFALGKALEDDGAYEDSFAHYAKGNALRRKSIKYDADVLSENVQRARAVFTPDFFHARATSGSVRRDPIFVVGLPRAGSTLIEQILSSHSQIEGTMELPDIAVIVRDLEPRRKRSERTDYPENLLDLEPELFAQMGEEYLRRAAIQRKLKKAYFIDKMPNNFQHIGFIQLILPNAKIIDARRHPLGCCLSNFKQHFARGQTFSYDLTDLGRYYRDYADLMTHFDAVLPGRIHRVFYERMVANPEAEIRALLAYCELPFEESCLRFYENDRAVRTASSEQVRQPIFTEGVDHWRHYESWLGPLKAALDPALDTYPVG
ncbi:MAG: sulfotransferase [Rhizomicrobium sp.]